MAILYNLTQYLLLLIGLTLYVTTTTPTFAKTTNDLITTTCKQTLDSILCESELRSDPRSSKAADSKALILIMIDDVKTRFSGSIQYVEGLARKTRDPNVNRALKECIKVYQSVLDIDIGLAVTAVTQGDPKFGEQAMTGAGNQADECQRAFPVGKIPGRIPGKTKLLHGVSNVAASMIKILE